MGRRVRLGSALVAGTLAFVVGTSTAHAALGQNRYKCQTAIASEAGKYIKGKLKLIQKCKDANLATPTSCLAPDPAALTKLVEKLNSGLAKKCSFDGADPANLAVIGFPGPCNDVSGSGNGFTLGDLQACIKTSHDDILTGVCRGGTNLGEPCIMLADCPDSGPGTFCHGMVGVEYDATVTGPLTGNTLKCQKEVAKNSAKFVASLMKSVQKCRNALLNCKGQVIDGNDVDVCKLSGLTPQSCATNDAKTASAVSKAKTKALEAIAAKCSDLDTTALKLCDPDKVTGSSAATCEIDIHQDLTDNPDPADVSDLLDYQYAQRGVCGDGRKNLPSEECDGNSDVACPGQCGSALGFFPCLCQDVPRTRVIEHANADLDNGWSGQSHDSGIVEGGGYVTDLWDCDGVLDNDCIVGPSCNLFPNQACNPARDSTTNADSICLGVGNFCRKTAGGSTGPHCEIAFKQRCRFDQATGGDKGDCTTPGDRCIKTAHGAPLPLSSGGVSVCVINEFTEDVTGTTNLATGAGSTRLRQNSSTFTGGDLQQPCPVCGGFCSGPGGASGPGVRNLCDDNADCAPGSLCVTEPICSWGPNIDGACRPNAPGGGPTEFFGNPSVDCPIGSASGKLGTINILFNPATTGTTSLTANLPCNSPGFNDKRCAGGSNEHAICTVASECPGGTCNNQCFCPQQLGENQRPNGCQAACLGGGDDTSPCTTDADCSPPGFCHPGDCRLNGGDLDSAQEGQCTVGPFDLRCSSQTWLPCVNDASCQAPACPFCIQNTCTGGANNGATCGAASVCPGGTCGGGETCEGTPRQCFVNPTINRAGSTAGYVQNANQERKTGAIFCISSTTSSSVNSVAGLPGPGAITQPAGTIEVGIP